MTKTSIKTASTKTRNDDTSLEDQAHALAAHGRELAFQAEQLERKLRVARGTRDVSREARQLVAPKHATRPIGSYSGREPDEMSTTELYNLIKRLVTERPQRFRDLVEHTQCGDNRIKGVLMRLQRDEVGLVNLGDQRVALWHIPSDALLKRLGRVRRR